MVHNAQSIAYTSSRLKMPPGKVPITAFTDKFQQHCSLGLSATGYSQYGNHIQWPEGPVLVYARPSGILLSRVLEQLWPELVITEHSF